MERIYAQGSIKEFEHDGDPMDRYYLPLRATAHALRAQTMVVVPQTPETIRYIRQLSAVASDLEQSTPDAIFVPDSDYFLDQAIQSNLSLVADRLGTSTKYQVYPYANTEYLRSWTGQLQTRGYQIETPMPERKYFEDLRHPQHRGGWGVWVDEPLRDSFATKYDLPYPRAYIGSNLEEAKQAYMMVASDGSASYAKLLFSAGGFGVQRIESIDQLEMFYMRAEASGALDLFGRKQPIEIQREITGVAYFASMQFSKGRLITPGAISTQIVDGNNWSGNMFNVQDKDIRGEAFELADRFTKAYKAHTGTEASGGLDLAVVREGEQTKLVIVEPNIARTVGADPGISLAQVFGVTQKPFIIRKTSEPRSDLASIWSMLKTDGSAFDVAARSGVFPLLWMNGSNGFLFASGESGEQLMRITDDVINSAHKNGYTK